MLHRRALLWTGGRATLIECSHALLHCDPSIFALMGMNLRIGGDRG